MKRSIGYLLSKISLLSHTPLLPRRGKNVLLCISLFILITVCPRVVEAFDILMLESTVTSPATSSTITSSGIGMCGKKKMTDHPINETAHPQK